jgi:hypothetical protein
MIVPMMSIIVFLTDYAVADKLRFMLPDDGRRSE